MAAAPAEPKDRTRVMLLAALLGAGVVAVWGMFGPHQGSIFRTPHDLQLRVQGALTQAGFPGLEVEMRGQQAHVRGVLATRDEITQARHVALTAAGAGGPWAGGVTDVNALHLQTGAIDAPYAWRAWRDGSSVVVSGAAPSETARRSLLDNATTRFPHAITLDQMHIAGGAPSPNWAEIANDALAQLATLNSGEVRINDTEIAFTGGGSQAAIAALRAHYHTAPAPFHVQLDLSAQ